MFSINQKPVFAYRQQTFHRQDLPGLVQALHQDGFALIPGVLGAEDVAAARDAIDRLTPFHWDYTGVVDHYKCVFNRDAFWLQWLDPPGVIELAEAVLGKDCHIIGQTAWRCHPGFVGVGVHADYRVMELPEVWLTAAGFTLPMQICTAHFYLSDITAELCPTQVIPGSHKSGRYPQARRETSWHGRGAEPVLCRAGDVLFFRSELWHSGSANQTKDQVRYLLQLHYARRMVAQKFSPYIEWTFDQEVIR